MNKNLMHLMGLPGFTAWFAGIPCAYILLKLSLMALSLCKGETKRGMPLTDYIPYVVVGFVTCGYIGCAGVILYFELFGVKDLYTVLAEDTVYGHSAFVEQHVFVPMFAYQFFNTVYSLLFKETRDVTMIVHHVAATAVAVVAMEPFLQHDAYFFFGFSELTNIPLTWIDLTSKVKGSTLKDDHPIFHGMMIALFVVLFLGIRVIVWPLKVIPVVYRLRVLMKHDPPLIHDYGVAWGFLIATAALTSMQIAWGRKIVLMAKRTLFPGKTKNN